MAIHVKGRMDGSDVELTWKDGALTGTPEAVARIAELARQREGEALAWGPSRISTTDHLHNPGAVMLLIVQALDDVQASGDDIPGSDLPPGAIP
jgi:hypothetical protein